MPPLLLRVLFRLSVLAMVACFVGVLAGVLLAFGPFASDLPILREEAVWLSALAALGLVLSGLTLGWLGREPDRTARTGRER